MGINLIGVKQDALHQVISQTNPKIYIKNGLAFLKTADVCQLSFGSTRTFTNSGGTLERN